MKRVVLALWVVAIPAAEAENSWLKRGWQYRVRLSFNSGQYARIDKPAEVRLNFTEMLRAAGLEGTFHPRSLRLCRAEDWIWRRITWLPHPASKSRSPKAGRGTCLGRNGSTSARRI